MIEALISGLTANLIAELAKRRDAKVEDAEQKSLQEFLRQVAEKAFNNTDAPKNLIDGKSPLTWVNPDLFPALLRQLTNPRDQTYREVCCFHLEKAGMSGVVDSMLNFLDAFLAEFRGSAATHSVLRDFVVVGELTEQTKLLQEIARNTRQRTDLAPNAELIDATPKSVGSGGKLSGVPDLPDFYLERSEWLERLKGLVFENEPDRVVLTAQKIGVHGIGGVGKTVLATSLALDENIRKQFKDGVFWLTLGQEPNILELQAKLARMAGEMHPTFESTTEGKDKLKDLFAGQSVLLVLDDVWKLPHAEAFQVLDHEGRVLLTTRIVDMLHGLGGSTLPLDVLDQDQALSLLQNTSGIKPPPSAKTLAKACGYLPLALAMAGAMLRGKPAYQWEKLAGRFEKADIKSLTMTLPGYPYDNLIRVFQVSLDNLEPELRDHYLDLAVFPEDVAIPESVLHMWWRAKGASDGEVEDWINLIIDRSLAKRENEQYLSLHDLQGDFLRIVLGREALANRHVRLVDVYQDHYPDEYPVLPQKEVYFYGHLAWHLNEAGRRDDLETVLLNFNWMRARLEATSLHGLAQDYRFVTGETFQKIRKVLNLSSHGLLRESNQLAAQFHARLDLDDPTLKGFLGKAKDRSPCFLPVRQSLTPPGGNLLRTFQGHSSIVNAVAALPDGRRALSASDDQTLKLWDLDSGEALATLSGHYGTINAVAILPDAQRALSASDDQTLKLWDLGSGEVLATLSGHSDRVTAVAVLPDGQRALSASRDKTLKLWDLRNGEALATLSGHSSVVNAVAVLPDGQHALSASGDQTLKLWDLGIGEVLATLSGHSDGINAVVVLPDCQRALSASDDQTLRLWDLGRGEALSTLSGHSSVVNAVAVLPDGRRALSASDDRILKLWDLSSGEVLANLSGHSDFINEVVVLPDGRRALSASWDRTLKLWDLGCGEALATLSGHSNWVTAVAVLPDGWRALSASGDQTLKLWDLGSGQSLATLSGHSGVVNAVAVLPDGRRVLSASYDLTLKLWDLDSGEALATLSSFFDGVTALAVLPEGRSVLSASTDHTLKLWDLDSGEALATLSGHSSHVRALAVLPNGRRALSASSDHTLKLWDLGSGEALATLSGHSGGVNAVAVLPDGWRALSASSDHTLKLWDLGSGEALATLSGHSSRVNAVVVLPDSWRALSASHDHTLKLWDLGSGEALATFTGEVAMETVQTDGQWVIAGDQVGNIHVLRLT